MSKDHIQKTTGPKPDSQAKIVPLDELARISQQMRKQGRKVVLCHGVFDLLHPGHIRHFGEAKQLGDILMVTITKDRHVNKGPGRPAFNEQLRTESVAALANIDYVALSNFPTAINAIRTILPDFYVKGQDYENRSQDVTHGIYEEEKAIQEVGGQIHFTHDINFSSSNLLNHRLGMYSPETRKFLLDLKSKFDANSIIDQLRKTKNLKVAVIGDTIIDEYHYCEPLGKSPKETIVSTKFQSKESFTGGVLACANHVAAFSDNVSLITCLGTKDSKQDFIKSHLNPKIKPHFFFRKDGCTVVKRRYVEPAFLTKMFQIAFMNDIDIPTTLSNNVCRFLKETLPDFDLVIVTDYGHGFITKDIRDMLCEKAPFLAINVQTNSANLGYNLVTKYPKAHYVCIDGPELRLAMSHKYTPIPELVSEFSKKYPDAIITITQGHKGSITTSHRKEKQRLIEVPSVSNRIVDRVGAGDAYFAVSSMLAAQHAPLEVLGFTGNIAGAIAVEVVCNRSSLEEVAFHKFIKTLLA